MIQVQTKSSAVGHLARAMRPHHWIKNTVVMAAPLFAFALAPATLMSVAVAFAAFSLTSSAFYLINDIRDIEADREHPVKRDRPIASGLISTRLATGVAIGLLVASIGISFGVAPLLGVALVAYALLQVGYNMGLKHQPILDIMTISAGFVLRALGGAAAADVEVSGWFILCIGLLAFFLGIEKRKAEIRSVGQEGGTRMVLRHYSLPLLLRMESVVTASAMMAYALWTIEGAETTWMLTTLPLVAFAIFKYQYLSEHGEGETPEKTLTKDPSMVATIVLWGLLVLAILWFTDNP